MSTIRVRSLAGSAPSPEEMAHRLISVSIDGLRDLGQRLGEVLSLSPAISEFHNSPRIRASQPRCGCHCTCGQRECCCRQKCCTCEVVLGDPPVRIRAHHWYDHFQCTERCECSDREREHV